jgi:hypothetical protein
MFCQRAYQLPKCRLRGDLEHFPPYSRQIQRPLSADSASLPAAKRVSNPSIWHPHGHWYFGPPSRTAKRVLCSFCCCRFYAESCSATLDHTANNTLTENRSATHCGSQNVPRNLCCEDLLAHSSPAEANAQIGSSNRAAIHRYHGTDCTEKNSFLWQEQKGCVVNER